MRPAPLIPVPAEGWPLTDQWSWFIEIRLEDHAFDVGTWRGKGATKADGIAQAVADATRALTVLSAGMGKRLPKVIPPEDAGKFAAHDCDILLKRSFMAAAGLGEDWPIGAPWTLPEALDAGKALARLIGATLPMTGLNDFKIPLGHAGTSFGHPSEWQIVSFGSRPGQWGMEYMPLPTPYRAALIAASVGVSRASCGRHAEDTHLQIASATLRAALANGLRLSFQDDLDIVTRLMTKVGLREDAMALAAEVGR